MNVALSKSAAKTLDALDKPTQARIIAGLEKLPAGDVKPLRGSDGDYRLRIGDWRILFSYADHDTIRIKRIAPRGGAYKGV